MTSTNNSDVPPLPRSDREAIQFALNHVDPLEIPDFLQDWLDGKPLQSWLQTERDQSASSQIEDAASLPAIGDASMSDAEMLALLKYPEIAVTFAADHLRPAEAQDFLRDWKQRADLAPWILAWRRNQTTDKS